MRRTPFALALPFALAASIAPVAPIAPIAPVAPIAPIAPVAAQEAPAGTNTLDYRTEDVRYPSGDLTLAALLMTPRSPGPHPAAVILQGSGPSDRTNPWARGTAEELVANGLAVLLTDKRGSGASEGDWRAAGFDALAGDALAGVALLRERPEVDAERIGLVGLSQGGWVAPLAAARSDDVTFVVNVSGASVSFAEQSFHEMAATTRQAGFGEDAVEGVIALNRAAGRYLATGDWAPYEAARRRALETDWAEIAEGFPGSPDAPVWTFLRRVIDFDPIPYWMLVDEPVLVVYGAEDERDNVPVAESVRRLESAFASARKEDYRIVVVPDAGHAVWDGERGAPARPFADALAAFLAESAGRGEPASP